MTPDMIDAALAYRTAKLVTHYYSYTCNALGELSFALCPTCNHPFERDYIDFCCGCGQRLKWGSLSKLKREDSPKKRKHKVLGVLNK